MLFAFSGGFCQNPTCLRALFVEVKGKKIHIAEMAHIIAATDGGPRSKPELLLELRGAYENIILLCPSCHTIIDKAESEFPDQLIREWKHGHEEKLSRTFATRFHGRGALRQAVEPILRENRVILDTYGPNSEYRFNPEADAAVVWHRKVLSTIVPNNKKLLMILDLNQDLLIQEELITLESFRQHSDDLARRHINDEFGGIIFPREMERISA